MMELIFQMRKMQRICIRCSWTFQLKLLPKEHEELSKFFRAEYFDDKSYNKGGPLVLLCGIQQCFIDIQNRWVRATDELSRMVIETAGQRPAMLKDFRTQELALERQTRLWELSKLEPIGTHQEEIAKKFCRFQIREEGSKLNSAKQNAIGFALSLLLDHPLEMLWPRSKSRKCSLHVVRNSAVSMVHQSVVYSMKACARSALWWPKLRPETRCPLAIAMVVEWSTW